jgi:hypothetical protein
MRQAHDRHPAPPALPERQLNVQALGAVVVLRVSVPQLPPAPYSTTRCSAAMLPCHCSTTPSDTMQAIRSNDCSSSNAQTQPPGAVSRGRYARPSGGSGGRYARPPGGSGGGIAPPGGSGGSPPGLGVWGHCPRRHTPCSVALPGREAVADTQSCV